MTTLTLVLPTIGQPDSTEDVKLNTALTAVQTWANGNIDNTNLSGSAGITAANLATALNGAWTSYTPTWTAASVNPAIGNGSLLGGYWVLGKTCSVRILMQAGSTTTFGTGQYSFALPFTAVGTQVLSQGLVIGNGGGIANSLNGWGLISGAATTVQPTSDGPVAGNGASGAVWQASASNFLTLQGVYQTS